MSPIKKMNIENFGYYLSAVFKYRNLCLSLARVDLRNRFRRTYLGILWVVLQPFSFSIILSIIFHYVFEKNFVEFSIYVFSGIVIWNWFSDTISLGSISIVQSQALIRQKKIPMLIYTIRFYLVSTTSFLISFMGLLVWFLVTGHSLSWTALLVPLNILILMIVFFPFCAFSGIVGALYRDYQQFTQILLQTLWFVSPVFIDKTVFLNTEVRYWDYINPISNILDLIRKPLLEGSLPSLENYLIPAGFGLVGMCVAYLIFRNKEDQIIYYL